MTQRMSAEQLYRELQQEWNDLHASRLNTDRQKERYPVGANATEAMHLLKTYYGPLAFIAQKMAFLSQFRGFTLLAITSELSRINEFIKTCDENEISWYQEALEWAKGTNNQVYYGYQPDMFRYILLKDCAYDNLEAIVNEASNFRMKGTVDYITRPDDDLATVYARYFLFKDYLNNLLLSPSNNRLSHKVIALVHTYLFEADEGEAINEENRSTIASSHKWTSRSSGEKIHKLYKDYGYSRNRTGTKSSVQEKKWHLETMKQVIAELEPFPKAYALALDELKTFEKNNLL